MTDEEAIARFIAERGVTRCPTAFAAESTGRLVPEDVAVHVARGIDPVGDMWRIKYGNSAVASFLSRGKQKTRWTEEMIATMRRLAREGHGFTSPAMVQALGVSTSTILKKARDLGLPMIARGGRPRKMRISGAGAPHRDGGTASPCPARDTAMAGPLGGSVEIAGDVGLARRGRHNGAPTPAALSRGRETIGDGTVDSRRAARAA